jgi:hypothetical protein
VRFAPSAAGARSAQLVISDSAGRSYTSDLAGYTWPGGTRVFVKSSDTTDWLGQGEVWSYSPAYGDSLEGGIQSTTGGFGATSANGAEHFAVWIDAPAGQTFTPGVVYDAVRNRGETPPYAGFDIGIYGHSCEFTYARFKFQSLEFGGSDGRATSYRIDFEVLCTQAKSPVQGTVEWQTTNPGPPWFGDLDEQPTTQEPDGAAGGGSAPDPARAPGAATSSDAGTAVAPTPSDAGAPADPTNPQLSSPPAATPTSKKRVRRRSRCHRRPPRHRTAKAKRRTAPSCGRRQKRTGRRR